MSFGTSWGKSTFNFTQCAIDAAALYNASPNSTFLVGSDGKFTNNSGDAWGITYEACNVLCGPRGGTEAFDWPSFSAALAQWVLPWLALTAQLPYETKDGPTNMMSLMLAVGSLMLVTYSLCITILNSRWLNKRFAFLRDQNDKFGKHQIPAMAAARYILRESQHIPIAIRDSKSRFAELVVSPANVVWWEKLQEEIMRTKRDFTYSLGAQTVWVVVTEGIAVLDFFTTIDSSTIGIGVAINSLWMWLIPITLGWVWVGTQNSAATIQEALMRASTSASLSSQSDHHTEGLVGFQDCSGENVLGHSSEDVEWYPEDSVSIPLIRVRSASSSATEVAAVITSDPPTLPEFPGESASIAQEIQTVQSPIVEPPTFIRPTLAGCATESGPIFNFARPWSHLKTCSLVIRSFQTLNENLRAKKPVKGNWSCDWKENLTGNSKDMERWIFKPEPSIPDHFANVGMICFQAAIIAAILQWGTTGAAILMAYNTPVIGLGCESGSYLLFGLAATLVWFFMVLSAYLSHLYAIPLSSSSRRKVRFHTLLTILIPTTRILGKTLAWINAGWLLTISLLQFANRYNNCWCQSCIARSGWVMLWATNSQVAQVAWGSWVGAVILGVVTAIGAALFFLNARGEEIFEKQRQ